MPDREIHTRDKKLDKDLTDLFELLEGGELPRLRAGLAKGTLTKAEFSDLFPNGALRLAVALIDPANYKHIAKEENSQALKVFEEARDGVSRELSNVLMHPLAREQRVSILAGRSRLEDSPLGDSFNRISYISHSLSWHGAPDALLPTVRVGFENAYKRLLLDSTLQIDDVSFVAMSLVEILTELMESGFDLAAKDRLGVSDSHLLEERLSVMEEYLAKARGFLTAFESTGASNDSDSPEAADPTKG